MNGHSAIARRIAKFRGTVSLIHRQKSPVFLNVSPSDVATARSVFLFSRQKRFSDIRPVMHPDTFLHCSTKPEPFHRAETSFLTIVRPPLPNPYVSADELIFWNLKKRRSTFQFWPTCYPLVCILANVGVRLIDPHFPVLLFESSFHVAVLLSRDGALFHLGEREKHRGERRIFNQ